MGVVDMQDQIFSLRRDRNGFRPVFPLGNVLGLCPYDCSFCGVKTTERVTVAQVKRRFDELCAVYSGQIDGDYHPVIYNRGNVTNPREFPPELLSYVLERFRFDSRMVYISINSREMDATEEFLALLAGHHLSFPVHFIFGLESFSDRMPALMGKNTTGELGRFVDKLRPYNSAGRDLVDAGQYVFGLDVNLVCMPELYLPETQTRDGNERTILRGIESELALVLSECPREVPIQVNLHPYHRVESLPFDDLGLDVIFAALPRLQSRLDEYNRWNSGPPVHLFVGVEGPGYQTEFWRMQREKWGNLLAVFNETGNCASP